MAKAALTYAHIRLRSAVQRRSAWLLAHAAHLGRGRPDKLQESGSLTIHLSWRANVTENGVLPAMKYSRNEAGWSGPSCAATTLYAITGLVLPSSFGMSLPDKRVDTNGRKRGLRFPRALPSATLRAGVSKHDRRRNLPLRRVRRASSGASAGLSIRSPVGLRSGAAMDSLVPVPFDNGHLPHRRKTLLCPRQYTHTHSRRRRVIRMDGLGLFEQGQFPTKPGSLAHCGSGARTALFWLAVELHSRLSANAQSEDNGPYSSRRFAARDRA